VLLAHDQRLVQRRAELAELQAAQDDRQVQAGEQQERDEAVGSPDKTRYGVSQAINASTVSSLPVDYCYQAPSLPPLSRES
jgi:hypothetical protein